MRFAKMHGLRNDFVVVDGAAEHVDLDRLFVRRICDRRTGIGADGLLLVTPPERGVDADLRMRVFNPDGSEPEMCGNGIRCVCKFAHDRGLCRKNPMRVQTGRGVLTLAYTLDPRGLVDAVTVDMGEPILDAPAVPVRLRDLDRVIDANFPLGELMPGCADWGRIDSRVTCVSMGNPHAVFYCGNVEEAPLDEVGFLLSSPNQTFPKGVNVHLVQVMDATSVRVRTWERGAGDTLACGTGGAAVCVAGALTGRTARRIRAHMPGGDLDLDWSERTNRVSMTGPAVLVFTGEWPD